MKLAKNILYLLTGWSLYTVGGLPIGWALEYFCPPSSHDPHCERLYLIIAVSCLILLPFCLKEWHRAGKWFWTAAIPALLAVAL